MVVESESIGETVTRELHRQIVLRSQPELAGIHSRQPRRIAGSPVVFPHPIEIPDLMRDFGEFLEQAPATPAAAFDARPYLNALAQIADKRAGFRSRGDI